MVDKKRKSKKGKSKKGLKQKQKQKQQVTVNVSSGGGGGGFIPAPVSQAPTFDYSLLANLIRPAATVDVPIMAQQMATALPARAAEPISLAEELPSRSQKEFGTQTGPMRKAPATPIKEESFKLSKFTQPMRERIAESGADVRLEKREAFFDDKLGVSGGGMFGGGGFERRATKKKSQETEELYNPDVPSAFI
jgi:hypothetical protein